jgi:hypothetical protein
MKTSVRLRLRTSARVASRRHEASRYFKALDKASRLVRFSLKARAISSAASA